MHDRAGDEMSGDQLLDRLAEIAHELLETPGVDGTLQRVVDTSRELISTCDDASMTFVDADGLSTPAATSARAYTLDRRQQELGEGPCLSALRDEPITVVDDLTTDERWPRWRATALERGYVSMLGLRLFVDGDTMGALNLYSEQPDAFHGRALSVARLFAAHASVAIKGSIAESGLERAVASRDVIGQAKGILMERERLSGEGAFSRLQQLSQQSGARLVEVARTIVETGEVPDLAAGHR